MATPKPENFLILEKSLVDRLVPRWKRQFAPIKKKLRAAIEDDDPITAQDVIESMESLDALYRGMGKYIEYISTSALLLGASRVRALEETSFMTGEKKTPDAAKKGAKQLEMFLDEGRKSIKRMAYQVLSAAERQKVEERDRLTFQKADKIKTLDDYMDMVESSGDSTISAAASLHTSRLSNYGFAVEAMVTGVEKYQVDEMLDSRTCQVCKYMHGKTFSIERTFGTLTTQLEVENPDDLRNIAPFPKQNAQAIADMKRMSLSELEAAGYNIPPYHPGCRGLLAEAGSIVEVEEMTSTPITSNVAEFDYRVEDRNFRNFDTASFGQMETWGDTSVAGWADDLTDAQRDAIETYKGSKYRVINENLRKGTALDTDDTKVLNDLKSSMDKAMLPEDVAAYRGVADLEEVFGTSNIDDLLGYELMDKGFMSTTIDSSIATGFSDMSKGAVVKVLLPKGAPAAYIDSDKIVEGIGTMRERELLVTSGARMIVVDTTETIRMRGDEYKVITVAYRGNIKKSDEPLLKEDPVIIPEDKFAWGEGELIVRKPKKSKL